MKTKQILLGTALTAAAVGTLLLITNKPAVPFGMGVETIVQCDSFQWADRHKLPIKHVQGDPERFRKLKDSILRVQGRREVPKSMGAVKQNATVRNFRTVQSPAPSAIIGPVIKCSNTVIPSDVHGSSNGSFIVQTTNQQVDILDSTGKILDTLAISQFYGVGEGQFYDLRAEVDNGRFWIVGDISDTAAGLWVSDTRNPLLGWHIYKFLTHSTTDFFDQPGISFNKDNVVITGNRFKNLLIGGSGPVGEQIFVANKQQALSGKLTSYQTFVDWFACSNAGTNSTTDTTWFISSWNSWYGYFHESMLYGTVPKVVYKDSILFQTAYTSIGSPQFLAPDNFKYADSANGLMVGDNRPQRAVLFGGNIYFTQLVGLPIYAPNPYLSICTQVGVDFLEVNPATQKVVGYHRFADSTGIQNYFYPSLAMDNKGDVLVAFQSSSDTNFQQVTYALKRVGDSDFEGLQTVRISSWFNFMVYGWSGNRDGDFINVIWDGKEFEVFCQGFADLYNAPATYGGFETYVIKVKV